MKSLFISFDTAYQKLLVKTSRVNLFTLIFSFVLIEFLVSLFFSNILFPQHNAGPTFESRSEAFFLTVIFAPLIETLIFQYLVISYLQKKKSFSEGSICIISAILFGLSHCYSYEYVLKTFISGLLFGTMYLTASRKNIYPFVPVAIAHAVYNFCVFSIQYLL
ncbi:lysostaphin resistance A-like protein [Sediminibacterium sp.]|uniref:CPBP family intramembrane glutamic endopeptidase n=1 Tax=Sediminibacterium sp. TaxID=1917865 RepID=UPI003F6A2D31